MKIKTTLIVLMSALISVNAIADNLIPTYETTVGKSLTGQQKMKMEAKWLAENVDDLSFYGVMPKSYDDTEAGIGQGTGLGYWQYLNDYNDAYQQARARDGLGTKVERALVHNGLDIYDGAVWQIALAIASKPPFNQNYSQLINQYYQLLNRGKAPEFDNLYATKNPNNKYYQYGWDAPKQFEGHQGYLLKFITPTWGNNVDPLTGDKVEWPEYSAITGEEAWAAFIGPIQSAYLLYNGKENNNWASASDLIKLAVQALPAIEAMQSDVGGIFYSVGMPTGDTAGKYSISLENNFSIYAGLTMLKQALESQVASYKVVDATQKLTEAETDLDRVNTILNKLKTFLENGVDNAKPFDTAHHIYYTNLTETGPHSGVWKSNDEKEFAVDVQTWGATVFGKNIDATFGAGTAYQMWQYTKEHASYRDSEGRLLGVGYTAQIKSDDHYEMSGEWTFGAINMVIVLADQYQKAGDENKANSLLQDAIAMKAGTEQEVSNMDKAENGKLSYLYANDRKFIPFGWYSNKIPATASTAWALFVEGCFDPLVLGGGEYHCPW